MAATTFPQFSRLPAELRNQIWQGALPDRIEPAICFYKKGCWLPREVAPSDEDYNPDPDGNLYFEFRHDLLDALQLEIPLYFVNHDARSIALGWICKHNVDIRKFQDTPAPVFTCPFKPIRDVLYAAPDTWDDFTREPNDRRFQQDLLDRHLLSGRMELEYIAIPAVWLRDDDAIKTLVDTLKHWFYSVQVLSIVIDPLPNLQFVDNHKTVQRRWELASIQGYDGVDKEALDRTLSATQKELANSQQPPLSVAKVQPVLAV